ncbi:Serine/threonine-protein phosphatase PP1-beta catalytic subunit [Strongyloides ratti]|uniref:Serine/threonine-protein phosphatase n=1 Tax=Strongyloides ratti TaxID=34506 RepID=A0A090MZE1_STRRB|nr:Serine/threonine-protein phosphatase PP1-beta catalytic subunit [Strongyloides ratti]CEF68774.1 Serine/threonine-protein phosphatase PP1-beta catalytic subunit [Strongyloides ratti]
MVVNSTTTTNIESNLSFSVEKIITRVLSVAKEGQILEEIVSLDEIRELVDRTKQIFMKQPVCLEIQAPVTICGDVHGQFHDLLRLFHQGGFPNKTNYLFLGDYVDRGKQSLETIIFLMCYKILFPNNFFLLRGNHECYKVNRHYGFYDEISRKYQCMELFEAFGSMFERMPISAIVGDKILCMHGGLSPDLKNRECLMKIKRPVCPYNNSFVCDLLWSDPDPLTKGFSSSIRGVSYFFGADVVNKICEDLKVDLICRGHQVVQDGYEFFADRKMVTIFSAPHYCGQYANSGAYMTVTSELACSFTILKPFIYKKNISSQIIKK